MAEKKFYILNESGLNTLMQQIASSINNSFTRKEVVTQIRNNINSISSTLDDIKSELIPTGTIIKILGISSTKAPSGYVKCNGAVYSISYHKNLADYIKTTFGSYNFFGGDGVTTFAVPSITSDDDNTISCIKV